MRKFHIGVLIAVIDPEDHAVIDLIEELKSMLPPGSITIIKLTDLEEDETEDDDISPYGNISWKGDN